MLWCDVGLRFVTPVQPLEGEGGKLLSHRRVALRYLRTDLLVDVMCRWPWDACVSGEIAPCHATRPLLPCTFPSPGLCVSGVTPNSPPPGAVRLQSMLHPRTTPELYPPSLSCPLRHLHLHPFVRPQECRCSSLTATSRAALHCAACRPCRILTTLDRVVFITKLRPLPMLTVAYCCCMHTGHLTDARWLPPALRRAGTETAHAVHPLTRRYALVRLWHVAHR